MAGLLAGAQITISDFIVRLLALLGQRHRFHGRPFLVLMWSMVVCWSGTYRRDTAAYVLAAAVLAPH